MAVHGGLETPTGEGDGEGLPPAPPASPSISSGLGSYYDTIGHQTAKVRGWEMGQGGWDGQRRDGGADRWRCRSSRSECGGMVAQRDVVPQPRKKKQTTGSTDWTDFTKLQSRDTTERNEKTTKNDNKDQETGLMATTQQTSSTPD